ncbi:hypothetical protein ES319_D09G095100v1 [Gossypium barbadense]|uniref:Centromere protein C n=1 Tax=Gossypium barbadense TaxID=3634 RepID=A0A5J5Q1C3_GOSBA|nr:hypothetical protein ES319_D09G095100v1 [Gossypium barbadense]KAB2012508.1 hypothetical protein ES319_D09G095100v1 [Gossypium barbadense]
MSISDAEEVMENPRERRPALGRKRARFSLKHNSSQPTVSLEPSLDIDKLNDPEEFFMAFDRIEKAKKEIQKQTGGVPSNLDENAQSMAARPRRPGIARRSVKYKHRYSTSMSPVESFDEELRSPLCGSQQEKSDPVLELAEKLAGSVTKAENNINQLLDHLLSSNYDGDEAVSLLKERLQIKPVDLDKICLPDLQDIRRIDLKASKENLTKPRNSISDLMKGISKRTPNRLAECSVHCSGSPTPPSSLASVSLLKKQSLRFNVLNDPFSNDDIDRSPVRNASPMENTSKQSDQVGIEKEPSVSHCIDRRSPKQQSESFVHHLASPTPPRNPLASMSLQNKYVLQLDPLSHPFPTDNIDKSPGGSASAVESIKKQSSQIDTEKERNVSQLLRRLDCGISAVSSGSQAGLENNGLSRPEVDTDSQTRKPIEFGGRVEDIPLEAVVSAHVQLNVEGTTIVNSHTIQIESDQANPAMDEDHGMDGPSRAVESGQELHEQQNKKGKTKRSAHRVLKRKEVSRRQSLAGAGTTFDTEGRRRSTRIRSRPLEFWKGERFLYGRVHSSLSTVIGIKYESPEKADGENPTLKVKSFVSDEYKDLVELAARF